MDKREVNPICASEGGAAYIPDFPFNEADSKHNYPQESTQQEIWARVSGFSHYWVSTHGRVKRVWPTYETVLKPAISWDGYQRVCLSEKEKKRQVKIARLVAETFLPNPKKRPMVLHGDGNSMNDHVENLYWGTHADNLSDEKKHNPNGRKLLGNSPWKSKAIAARIREEAKSMGKLELMKKYGIRKPRLERILRGWAYAD